MFLFLENIDYKRFEVYRNRSLRLWQDQRLGHVMITAARDALPGRKAQAILAREHLA
jgi:hypothetical protein